MKKVMSNSFKNATIDVNEMTITEKTKDGDFVFNLHKVLEDWAGVPGLSISIKKDEDVVEDE